jgi:hypothetical protein
MPRAYFCGYAGADHRAYSGASRREAAEYYDISPSTAVIWCLPPSYGVAAYRRWKRRRTAVRLPAIPCLRITATILAGAD